MRFAKSYKGRPKEKYALTSGFGEPMLDHFKDVKRALNEWLLQNDDEYRRNSELRRERTNRRLHA